MEKDLLIQNNYLVSVSKQSYAKFFSIQRMDGRGKAEGRELFDIWLI
jgi:hypothetical protein